jgi:hypothetical protein
LEKDKPPILGLIQRDGQVVLRMLANVQQTTLQPIIEAAVATGTRIHTAEYGICHRRVNPVQIGRLNFDHFDAVRRRRLSVGSRIAV